VRGTIYGAPMGGWEFAKAMVDMSQWLQSTGCRLNNPMLFDRSFGNLGTDGTFPIRLSPQKKQNVPSVPVLQASKSIQSQIAAMSSVRSLLRPHCFAALAAVGCGSPK
jgi:hypothetical protein